MRYAALVAKKFPQHPSAKDPKHKAGLKAATNTLPAIIEKLELLNPRINARYATWQKALERRKEANVAVGGDAYGARTRMDSDPAVAGKTTTLAAAEHSDLAVKLANHEIRRRETKRRATRYGGVSEQEEQDRRTAGLWDDWEAALSNKTQPQNDDALQQDMQAAHRRMDGTHDTVPDGARKRITKVDTRLQRPESPRGSSNSNEYRYPSIPKSRPIAFQDNHQPARSKSPVQPTFPPKPPKERFEESQHEEPPPRPGKSAISIEAQHPNQSDTARDYTFEPSAYLENGNPLRTVFLPPTLRDHFLQIAAPNTRNNLETCGMLCGTLVSNALFISHVVIPEQESTSDTCETVNESAFFDYCASEDLMVLGWIHTHPTQTCFMSSRDLHTHCGYQIMMAESIAIVCAPSKNPS